jgi:hypothetical protein
VVSRGVEGHVYGLKLDRGEFTEAALPTLPVVGPLDPDHDRQAQFRPGGPSLLVEDVFCNRAKKGSIAALSPQAPNRHVDPDSPTRRTGQSAPGAWQS